MTCSEGNCGAEFFGCLGPRNIESGRVGAITQYTEKKSENKVRKGNDNA